jgi:uncharacterized Zn finger protein
MTHQIPCPSCRDQLQVPDDLLGQRARCPSCGEVFTTALTEEPPAPRPAADAGVTATATAPAPARLRGGFRCPHCGSQEPPRVVKQISTAGWVVFVVLLLTCFPLFWIGLLITEEQHRCHDCGARLS